MYSKLSELVGSRPKVYNLKDSDALKDKEVLIKKVEIHEGGEFGVFVVLTSLLKDGTGAFAEEALITTGATDIVGRIVPIADRINGGNYVVATFHKIGRKWLID